MYRKAIKIVPLAMLVLFVVSAMALAAGQKMSGKVVAVEEEVVTLQGDDGKTYEVEVAKEIVEDLKTGAMVEFEIVDGQVLNVKKKK